MAILSDGSFVTPLGEARIDATLAAELAQACPLVREDAVAHAREHSLEVQLPFLQRIARERLRIAPVVLATDRYGAMEELGRAVAEVVRAQNERVLIVASSDMNHYESDDVTRAKDEHAIARILALDPRGLYDTVRNEGITMCGYAATVAMLVAVRELGARRCEAGSLRHFRRRFRRPRPSGRVRRNRHLVGVRRAALASRERVLRPTPRRLSGAPWFGGSGRFPQSTSVAQRDQRHRCHCAARTLPHTQQDDAEAENERDGNRPYRGLPIANIHPPYSEATTGAAGGGCTPGSCSEAMGSYQIPDIYRAESGSEIIAWAGAVAVLHPTPGRPPPPPPPRRCRHPRNPH